MKIYYVSTEKPLRIMDRQTAEFYIALLDDIEYRIMQFAGWYLKFGYREIVQHDAYTKACREKWEILNELAEAGYFNSGISAHMWHKEHSRIPEYTSR